MTTPTFVTIGYTDSKRRPHVPNKPWSCGSARSSLKYPFSPKSSPYVLRTSQYFIPFSTPQPTTSAAWLIDEIPAPAGGHSFAVMTPPS
eukprot:31003-Pelagococcus_subviridis.AAC.14